VLIPDSWSYHTAAGDGAVVTPALFVSGWLESDASARLRATVGGSGSDVTVLCANPIISVVVPSL